MTDYEKWRVVERQVIEAGNLVAALQLIAEDLATETIPPGSRLHELRSAVIGIGDALEKALADDPACEVNRQHRIA